MRSATDIRTQLLRLRDVNQLTLNYIADTSRCTPFEVRRALGLDGSEATLRKLDAFLDAPQLHVIKKNTGLLYRIEKLDSEMWREYRAKNLHPLTIQAMSVNQQKRLLNAMDNRAKMLLRDKVKEETGVALKFPDGLNYWQCKAKARARGAAVRATL